MPEKRPSPVPPPSTVKVSVHARTMLAAADIIGGLSALAGFLNVPREELIAWMTGVERPPESIFLAAVDVVLDDNDLLRRTFHPEKGSKAVLRPDPKA